MAQRNSMLQAITDDFRLDLLNGTSVTLSYDSYKSGYLKSSVIGKYFDALKARLPIPGLTVLNLLDFGFEDFGVFGQQLRSYIEKARSLLGEETRKKYLELLERYLEFVPEDLRLFRSKLLEIYAEIREKPKTDVQCPIDDYRMVTYRDIDSEQLQQSIRSLPEGQQQVDQFVRQIELKDEARTRILQLIDHLNESLAGSELSELRPKLLLFGSLATNLACYDADLDLVVHFEAFESIELLDYETSWLALKVIQLVWERKLGMNMNYDRAIVPSRRCPLIILDFQKCFPKISQQVTRMNQLNAGQPQIVFNKANISIRSLYGYYNSKVMERFTRFEPRFREMNLILKYWVKRVIGLIGKDNICSYALTLMIVFFMQNTEPPILPPIEHLQKKSLNLEPIKVHLYNFEFTENIESVMTGSVKNRKSTIELLIEFVRYYNNFNTDLYAICPRTGGQVSKAGINHAIRDVAQPTDINSLFRKSNITIQDPFVDTNNVGLNFQLMQTSRWKQALRNLVANSVSEQNCVLLLSGQVGQLRGNFGRHSYY